MVNVGGKMKTLRLLLAASLLVVGFACASGGPETVKPQASAPLLENTISPAALVGMRMETSPSRLILQTSGSPAYTSYNPQPDVFVIDLPATSKANGLVVPSDLPSFVASVAAEEAIELGKPLTRVTVRFITPMSPQATGSADRVVVDFGASQPSIAAVETENIGTSTVVEGVASALSSESSLTAAEVPTMVTAEMETPVAMEVIESPSAQKATKLKAVQTTGRGESLAVVLTGDGAIDYSVSKLSSPLRLVIDLKGIRNQVKQKSIEVADPTLKRVRISQFKSDPSPVTRVVLDLDELPQYRMVRSGSSVHVLFGTATATLPVETEMAAAVQLPPMERTEPVMVPPMTTVIANSNEGPVTVSKAYSESQLPPAVVAEIPTVAKNQIRASASAPVGVINSPAMQEAPRPRGPVSSSTTATLPQSTVRTTPIEDVFIEQPEQRAGSNTQTMISDGIERGGSRTLAGNERVYTGEPVSLALKDADIKDVLRTFAQLTGLNIAIDPGVSGTVTVEFNEVPWDQALDLILRQNGLGYEIEGNVMRIGTLDRLASESSANRRREEERRLSVATTSVARRLSYAKADDISGLLTQLASPRGRIITDSRTNQIIVTDIPDALRLMLNLVDTVDIPTPQVVIEARIVETTKNFSQQFGFSIGFNGDLNPALGTGTGLIFPNRIRAIGGPFNLATGNNVLQLSLGNVLGTFDLDLLLAAAENEGLARVISAPRVATQDNRSAEIQSGLQIPFQTRVNFTTTVSFVDATLRLTVTPQITAEDTVIMDIQVQKVEPASALSVTGAENVPLINRRAQTRLMVRDGGTAVIGGIYQATDNTSQNRIPILHSIPVLGNLFKNRVVSQRHDELLIFITPRIVREVTGV